MYHDGFMSWGMGFGWMGILFWVVLILALAAIVKYVFGRPDDRD
jgi:hypothetical protein